MLVYIIIIYLILNDIHLTPKTIPLYRYSILITCNQYVLLPKCQTFFVILTILHQGLTSI